MTGGADVATNQTGVVKNSLLDADQKKNYSENDFEKNFINQSQTSLSFDKSHEDIRRFFKHGGFEDFRVDDNSTARDFSKLASNRSSTDKPPTDLTKTSQPLSLVSGHLKWLVGFGATVSIFLCGGFLVACCCLNRRKNTRRCCCLAGKDWGSYEVSQLSLRLQNSSCQCQPSQNRPSLQFSAFAEPNTLSNGVPNRLHYASNKHLCCSGEESKQGKGKKSRKKLKQDFKANKKKEKEWYV